MATSSEKRRAYQGPIILSYGFRPFFFFGALWAALAVPLWILSYAVNGSGLPFEMGVAWHAHEMTFGYTSAIIAGFLLTAVPNWTGRLPIFGTPLLALMCLWIAGRLGLLLSSVPSIAGAALDGAFLVVFTAVIFREVLAGNNRRNVKIAILLSLLAMANIGFHLSQIFDILSFDMMLRMGLGTVLMLIVIIGGRVTPSFTTNWLKKRGDIRPVPFNRFDMIVMIISAFSIISWIIFPYAMFVGAILLVSGGLNLLRLLRWKFWATFSEPLVLILHIGYGWAVTAFILNGAASLKPDMFPAISGLHAIGTGAIGVMTLAIMTRATLGHSGRELRAGFSTVCIYLLVNLAALTRVSTPFFAAELQMTATIGAAIFWSLAFSLYCLIYGRYLWRPRLGA